MDRTLPKEVAEAMPRFSKLYARVAYFEKMNPGSMASVRAEVETIKRRILLVGIAPSSKRVWEAWAVERLIHINAECRWRDLEQARLLKKRRRLN